MKYLPIYILILALLPNTELSAQETTLSLEEIYSRAKENYPLSKQRDLIRLSSDYTIENLRKGWWPQANLQGQASHQSDVTSLPIHLPGVDLPSVNKAQYRLVGEISQTIYDGGITRKQIQLSESSAIIATQQLEAELYQLRERINQLFFGILLTNQQLAQTDILRKDILSGIEKIYAAIENGTAIKSNEDVLKAELLKLDQRVIELKFTKKAFLDMLGLYLNQQLDENIALETPPPVLPVTTIARPELKLFDYQRKKLDLQHQIIDSRNKPKLSLFLQTGFGNPSPVNMLSNKISGFYIAGIRLNWSFSGFYTAKNEKTVLDISRRTIDVQQEQFLFNTTLSMQQQQSGINKWAQMIETDKNIIALRQSIKNTAAIQLENGLIHSSDYLREVNAEDLARQNMIIHQIQMLLTQYQYKTTTGN